MRGASLRSLEALEARYLLPLARQGEEAESTGQELEMLVDALDDYGALLRQLANPNADLDARLRLVQRIAHHANALTKEVLADAVSMRWGRDSDLADALERFSIWAFLVAADSVGIFAKVSEELFSVDRFISSDRKLRRALDDGRASAEARGRLAARVFGPALSSVTLRMVVRCVTHPRGRNMIQSLLMIEEILAAHKNRSVARVTCAVPLAEPQALRLKQTLSTMYGRDIDLSVQVDPQLLGGLRIMVGDDLVDASVLSRLRDAERALAS